MHQFSELNDNTVRFFFNITFFPISSFFSSSSLHPSIFLFHRCMYIQLIRSLPLARNSLQYVLFVRSTGMRNGNWMHTTEFPPFATAKSREKKKKKKRQNIIFDRSSMKTFSATPSSSTVGGRRVMKSNRNSATGHTVWNLRRGKCGKSSIDGFYTCSLQSSRQKRMFEFAIQRYTFSPPFCKNMY